MVQVQWRCETSAANKSNKSCSFECWHQIQVIVHSISQHSLGGGRHQTCYVYCYKPREMDAPEKNSILTFPQRWCDWLWWCSPLHLCPNTVLTGSHDQGSSGRWCTCNRQPDTSAQTTATFDHTVQGVGVTATDNLTLQHKPQLLFIT